VPHTLAMHVTTYLSMMFV